MKRIPRIKFPQRNPKLSTSATTESKPKEASETTTAQKHSSKKSDVPASSSANAIGGKASLQPKRTPVSDKEIEAIMLGGCV